MSRPLRIEFPGAVYHVASRGNFRQDIFLDDGDRLVFLDKIASSAQRYSFIVHAYCLMSNHYHLLIETLRPNLSRAMQMVNSSFTRAVNGKYGRMGHLFQGRFKAVLVEKETYLLEAARYVVLNPVRARMVERLADWKWSSYRATAGMEDPPCWLETSWILARFGGSREAYMKFVAEGMMKKGSPFDETVADCLLGSRGFLEKWEDVIANMREDKEIPRFQKPLNTPPLEAVFEGFEGLGKRELAEKVREAHLKHGYLLNEIAAHIGVHYSTAGRMLKRLKANPLKNKGETGMDPWKPGSQ